MLELVVPCNGGLHIRISFARNHIQKWRAVESSFEIYERVGCVNGLLKIFAWSISGEWIDTFAVVAIP